MQAQCGDQMTAMLCSSGSKALTLVSQMQAMLCSNGSRKLTLVVSRMLCLLHALSTSSLVRCVTNRPPDIKEQSYKRSAEVVEEQPRHLNPGLGRQFYRR